ncbi:hypothetical protein BGW39_005506 [Mortierella sp. 14UC]|nr:hypothetical protein BGW39_005506 [Mortierella sp. 14UC]
MSSESSKSEKVSIVIVGAGIAGLVLTMLLEKVHIPYNICERAVEVKPLGSAIFFNATTAKLFKQCGIYEEMMSIAKLTHNIKIANEKREVEYTLDFAEAENMFGSSGYIVSRPMLYALLLRRVPKERIHMNKKVLNMHQTEHHVEVEFQDGSTARGDILVGADGAYIQCLVGQTRPLDPEEFPNLKIEGCQFIRTLGNSKPYTWTYFTTRDGRVAWMCIEYLSRPKSKEDGSTSHLEWGPEAAEVMCNQVRDFPIISGGEKPLTIGNLIDWTPKELISKVMQEEKIFQTWYHGRAVLIGDGDACHKLSPAGGSGANCAIHDALCLASRINAFSETPSRTEIEKAFQAYSDERIPWVEAANNSGLIFKTMVEQNFKAAVMRSISRNMPQWIARMMGTIKSVHQENLHDTLPIVEERRRVKEAATGTV